MKHLSVKSQIVVGLLLSLLVSFLGQQVLLLEPGFSLLFSPADPETIESTPTAVPIVEPTLESTSTEEILPTEIAQPTPYVTLDEALMVRVKLFQDDLPLIESVTVLPEGRLSVINEGSYSIQLVDLAGNIVHELLFEPTFLVGESMVERDEVTMLFILSVIDGVNQVIVQSPFGEVNYDYK